MERSRAADDFAVIRAQMEELKRERERAERPRAADDFTVIQARMEELKRDRERAAHNAGEGSADARRWRLAVEHRARVMPRRN